MTEYEREWTGQRGLPDGARIRVGLTKRGGRPIRFLVQLEYEDEGEWLAVARSEHDVNGPSYRNVELAGIHIDLHQPDGQQFSKLTGFPPEPANEAMGRAEDFLRQHADAYVRRFESWL